MSTAGMESVVGTHGRRPAGPRRIRGRGQHARTVVIAAASTRSIGNRGVRPARKTREVLGIRLERGDARRRPPTMCPVGEHADVAAQIQDVGSTGRSRKLPRRFVLPADHELVKGLDDPPVHQCDRSAGSQRPGPDLTAGGDKVGNHEPKWLTAVSNAALRKRRARSEAMVCARRPQQDLAHSRQGRDPSEEVHHRCKPRIRFAASATSSSVSMSMPSSSAITKSPMRPPRRLSCCS